MADPIYGYFFKANDMKFDDKLRHFFDNPSARAIGFMSIGYGIYYAPFDQFHHPGILKLLKHGYICIDSYWRASNHPFYN